MSRSSSSSTSPVASSVKRELDVGIVGLEWPRECGCGMLLVVVDDSRSRSLQLAESVVVAVVGVVMRDVFDGDEDELADVGRCGSVPILVMVLALMLA